MFVQQHFIFKWEISSFFQELMKMDLCKTMLICRFFKIKISSITNSSYSVFRKNCIVCTTRHISFGGKKILKMGGLQSYFHFVNFSTKIFQISYWKQVKSKLIVPNKACFFLENLDNFYAIKRIGNWMSIFQKKVTIWLRNFMVTHLHWYTHSIAKIDHYKCNGSQPLLTGKIWSQHFRKFLSISFWASSWWNWNWTHF